jgi:hypothetical protein
MEAGDEMKRIALVLTLASNLVAQQAPANKKVLDILRVRAEGDPAGAVVTLKPGPIQTVTCDLAIIGAGMGGSAAALAATKQGLHVCMTEPTLWVGGQTTSQGVSAFDDNKYIDTSGGTASYLAYSRRIREYYAALRKDTSLTVEQAIRTTHPIASNTGKPGPMSDITSNASGGPMANPGGCWVGRLCFEPAPAAKILLDALQPSIAEGRLVLYLHTIPVEVERSGRNLNAVLVYDFSKEHWLKIKAKYFIDASEMGDLLPLTGLPFRMGAEGRAETHERDASPVENRLASQSFTYTFILSNPSSAARRVSLPKPVYYDEYKSHYSLQVDYGHGFKPFYGFFEARPKLPGSFWIYRRSVEASKFRDGAFDGDRAMINWSSNDHCDANLLSEDPALQAKALQNAKRLSTGFAWWMQNEVPRDDNSGVGYPQLTLLKDAMGSPDGLSQHPYIRESRRIYPLRTIVEEDLGVDFQKGARAAAYPDSIAIGSYPIDIHSCEHNGYASASKPYQVPLSALIPRDLDNLVAASKNIGTTHLTNGAYRLHPTEWAIGEAAGDVIAVAIHDSVTPAQIVAQPPELQRLQKMLVGSGHPIVWYDDVAVGSEDFPALQMAGVSAWLHLDAATLHASPDLRVTDEELATAIAQKNAATGPSVVSGDVTRLQLARWMME